MTSVEPELTAEAAAEVLVQPEEKPKAVEEEPEPIPELVETVEPAREPVPVLDQSSSIRDVSSDVFSVRRAPIIEPGVIRFAEDIDGLRGGVTVRQGRRRGAGGAGGSGRGRKSKARRRR